MVHVELDISVFWESISYWRPHTENAAGNSSQRYSQASIRSIFSMMAASERGAISHKEGVVNIQTRSLSTQCFKIFEPTLKMERFYIMKSLNQWKHCSLICVR